MKKKIGITAILLLIVALAVPLLSSTPVLGDVAVSQLITTPGSGTFTVPAGVTSITVEGWGAGGAGGGSTSHDAKAGGGGGGAYAKKTFSVTPGSNISYYVAPATTGTTGDGPAGAATWFLANSASGLVAVGGSGGTTAGVGGAGGNAALCYGDTVFRGGNGGNFNDGYGGGGGGGAGSTGPGNDASADAGGASKDEYGGAGGTGCHSTGNTAGSGGSIYGGASGGVKGSATAAAGAQGLIRITYLAAGYWDLTMAANPVAGGTTTPTGTAPYANGTVVNITASAAAGYVFVNWTAPAGTFGNATAAATNFTMPSNNVTVTANFVAAVGTYNLTMQVSPPGGGTTTPTGIIPYANGTVVNITASAAAGYSFANWTAVPALSFGNIYAAATNFTMPAQNVTVTANFVAAVGTYNLTMVANPGAGGTTIPTGTNPYTAGTVVNITASVVTGYSFANWTAVPALSFGDMYAAATNFTMPSNNVTVTANFIALAPVAPVGGTAYPINKLVILAPWMALGAAIIVGIAILARRRRAQS
jgi:uncharacterized repeat protein (TIGR02543 family)